MSSFLDLITTFTARLGIEEDFAFVKTREELALRIRSNHLGRIRELWSPLQVKVSIDRDGDIVIDCGEKGRLYVTEDGIVLSGAVSTIRSISKGQSLEQMANVLDELLKSRSPLRAVTYQVRLFLRLQFREPVVTQMLQSQYFFTCLTTGVDSNLQPGKIRTMRWWTSYAEQEFTDTLELQVRPSEFETRYTREGAAENFPSFRQFASAAEIDKITERMRPFVEPLIYDPSKLHPFSFMPLSGPSS